MAGWSQGIAPNEVKKPSKTRVRSRYDLEGEGPEGISL